MGEGILTPIIEWKVPILQTEFGKLDNRLQIILYTLAGYTYYNFGKGIILTELLRTQEEQDKIYSESEEYKQRPWKSVHQFGRGADVSIKYFTAEEIENIVRFLNDNFLYVGAVHTALVHNVGYGMHLHIQTDNEDKTCILGTTHDLPVA